MLIIEGGLRKWVLPGLAQPLLIVRDPVAIYLIYKSTYSGLYRFNEWINTAYILTAISLCLTLIVGHGNLVVALYGCRIMLLHFPLIFIIGHFLSADDVLKIGKCLLYITIAMTVLVAWQFYSPQSAWINRGIGGDLEGSGFSGAGGYKRVPGMFSFTNGLTHFYGLVLPFILYFWLVNKTSVNKFILILATLAYILAIPLSISRSVFFQTVLTFLFLVAVSATNKKIIGGIAGIVFFGFFGFVLLLNLNFFSNLVDVLQTRFQAASASEGDVIQGTLIDRIFGGLLSNITNPSVSWVGQGLGMGTNAGAKLISGTKGFLISEGEWGRLIGERGYILGMVVIFMRILVVFKMGLSSWKATKSNNLMSWLLLSFVAQIIILGQWGQPTSLGFAILGGGLLLASLKITN
ncbi:hypothetical protein [Leeuwenhoekiella sp. LLG6367-2.1]|uniref:hypothetical protein n=1 Tax=Leeuwenhoekiella sp. LLG6367-2.1 TaxID=3160833 RepID=UPI003865C641